MLNNHKVSKQEKLILHLFRFKFKEENINQTLYASQYYCMFNNEQKIYKI